MSRSGVYLMMVAGLLIAGASPARSHALRHDLLDRATAVRWTYDGSAPVAGCDVIVLAPGSGEVPYTRGVTDQDGTFAFLPHTNGRWTLTVEDGQGHRADVYVDVVDGVPQWEARTSTFRQPGAILVGVGTLLGGFGLYALFVDRFKKRSTAATA